MAKRILRYKGTVCIPTSITTDIHRTVFGKRRRVVARVWKCEGRHSKPAGMRPFLTSASEAKAWLSSNFAGYSKQHRKHRRTRRGSKRRG